MKNIKKVKAVEADRSFIVRNLAFKLGYQDAYFGSSWSKAYDRMVFKDQLQYEQGRLIGTALKSRGVAPRWKTEVQCPRDLPRLIREYGHGVVPVRQKVSA